MTTLTFPSTALILVEATEESPRLTLGYLDGVLSFRTINDGNTTLPVEFMGLGSSDIIAMSCAANVEIDEDGEVQENLAKTLDEVARRGNEILGRLGAWSLEAYNRDGSTVRVSLEEFVKGNYEWDGTLVSKTTGGFSVADDRVMDAVYTARHQYRNSVL